MSNQVRWEECPSQLPRSVRLQHGWLHQLGVRRRSRRSTAPATHQLPWYPPIGCNMNGKIWQIINKFTTFDFYSYCSRLSCIVQSNVSTPCVFCIPNVFVENDLRCIVLTKNIHICDWLHHILPERFTRLFLGKLHRDALLSFLYLATGMVPGDRLPSFLGCSLSLFKLTSQLFLSM